MLDAPSMESVEQDKPDDDKKESRQQNEEQSVVQPSSDAEVTIDLL